MYTIIGIKQYFKSVVLVNTHQFISFESYYQNY